MRFRFEHQDVDAGKVLSLLADRGFQGAVSRFDLPDSEKAVVIDVREDVRTEEIYKVVREISKNVGLVPHPVEPEIDRIFCRKKA